jgi:hypothetical protein
MSDSDHKLFLKDDPNAEDYGITIEGEHEEVLELFELYEKIKISYVNVFYRIPPNEEQLKAIQQQVQVKMKEMAAEMQVGLMEQDKQMQEAVQAGKMIPERYQLEMEKAQKMMQQQLQAAEQEYMSQLQAEASKIENKVISEKEFKILMKDEKFQQSLVDAIQFYGTRIKQTCIAGDTQLYEQVYPENVTGSYTLVQQPVTAVASFFELSPFLIDISQVSSYQLELLPAFAYLVP